MPKEISIKEKMEKYLNVFNEHDKYNKKIEKEELAAHERYLGKFEGFDPDKEFISIVAP